jgi:hypothetical protein
MLTRCAWKPEELKPIKDKIAQEGDRYGRVDLDGH